MRLLEIVHIQVNIKTFHLICLNNIFNNLKHRCKMYDNNNGIEEIKKCSCLIIKLFMKNYNIT